MFDRLLNTFLITINELNTPECLYTSKNWFFVHLCLSSYYILQNFGITVAEVSVDSILKLFHLVEKPAFKNIYINFDQTVSITNFFNLIYFSNYNFCWVLKYFDLLAPTLEPFSTNYRINLLNT